MIRAFQWDLARQVERLDWLLAQLPRYAAWGYQELYLHLEDAVDYPSLPGVARADAYRWSELEQLVAAATAVGIGVVPIVNLLGHTQYLIKTHAWRDLNELRAPDGSALATGQICPLHPRTPEVVAALLHDVAPLCTTGKVHVGLDESFHLGKHPLSRAEIAEVGLATHFARYVQRLHALCSAHQLRLGMWADMLALLPEAIPQLPTDIVAYDWYYHAFSRHPRFEMFNYREVDLATPLRARGIEYWGCPMNGAFRHEPLPIFRDRIANAQSWWTRCHRVGATGMLVTGWEPYRLALETTVVVDAAIAGLWLDPAGPADQATLLRRGLERVYGPARAAARARALFAADERPFAGYARWEINQRWDTFVHRQGPAPYAAEARFFDRLVQHQDWPAAFAASLRWRLYLAQRDLFVRRAARAVLRLRRRPTDAAAGLAQLSDEATAFADLLKQGRAAARAMWLDTREPQWTSQNLSLLDQDAARLKSWRAWLRAAFRRPALIDTASVMAGRWNLQLTVHNIRPATQCVVVQQQSAAGEWRDLAKRYTIEFRTAAARRTTRLAREWSVPIKDPDLPLRLTLRGVGEVAISHVQLTDGRTTRANRGWPPRVHRRLGHPAPVGGWVDFDPTRDADTLALLFWRRINAAPARHAPAC